MASSNCERSLGLTPICRADRWGAWQSRALTDSHERSAETRRFTGGQFQSGPWRAPADIAFRVPSAGLGRGMVARFARQSLEAKGRHGASSGPCTLGQSTSEARADPRDGNRARVGYAIYGGYASSACAPVPKGRLRLDDGIGQSGAVPSLEAVAEDRAAYADRDHCAPWL